MKKKPVETNKTNLLYSTLVGIIGSSIFNFIFSLLQWLFPDAGLLLQMLNDKKAISLVIVLNLVVILLLPTFAWVFQSKSRIIFKHLALRTTVISLSAFSLLWIGYVIAMSEAIEPTEVLPVMSVSASASHEDQLAQHLVDQSLETFWLSPQDAKTQTLSFALLKPQTLNEIHLLFHPNIPTYYSVPLIVELSVLTTSGATFKEELRFTRIQNTMLASVKPIENVDRIDLSIRQTTRDALFVTIHEVSFLGW